MATHHAGPGEIIDVRPLESKLPESRTTTLVKTNSMEVLRLVMPAGKQIAEHQARGEIIVQCIEGSIRFTTRGETKEMVTGDLLYLDAAEPHAVEAIENASILVTILLGKGK